MALGLADDFNVFAVAFAVPRKILAFNLITAGPVRDVARVSFSVLALENNSAIALVCLASRVATIELDAAIAISTC